MILKSVSQAQTSWLMTRMLLHRKSLVILAIALLAIGSRAGLANAYETDLGFLVRQAQAAAVKIYGAGGGGLVAYQSGFLVSPDGHVATAWSYVLDVEPVVVLDDGRRFNASIVGFEPRLELAVLKIEADSLPYLELASDVPELAEPILAVSNLFGIASGDEPASVMQGTVSSISRLDARRGTFKTPYTGTVLILDLVANNPGAAGGAVVDSNGRAVGMLGKELRDAAAGVWLNYALPSSALREAVGNIVAGRAVVTTEPEAPMLPREQSHHPEALGINLIPNVLENTPAFVDRVLADSAAARAGVRPDDLVLLIGNVRIDSQRTLLDSMRRIDRRDPVVMTLQRGSQIVSITLMP
jgi:S1-C subfamily serine protease